MSAGDFNIGSDLTLTVNTANGILRMSIITESGFKPRYHDIDFVGLDGTAHYEPIFLDHEFHFGVTRSDATIDDYFTQLELNQRNGVGSGFGTITQLIREADGSISTYEYGKVKLKLDDAGTWKGNDKIDYKLSGRAQTKRKI